MNNEIKLLQQERCKLNEDYYNNIIPKRIPAEFQVMANVVAEFGGINMIDYQYEYSLLEKPARELCKIVYSDKCPVNPASPIGSRNPSYYQTLGSQTLVMGKNGFMQHPEVTGMNVEDYDALIEDPFACIMERIIPRHCKSLDPTDPIGIQRALFMSDSSLKKDLADSLPFVKDLTEEYGYSIGGAPAGSMAFCAAPYDFLSDQLRGFSGISMDIRRDRNKIKDACEALTPLMFYAGLPTNPHPQGFVGTPLHMPTFMREKDFEEIWLPSYIKITQQWASFGVRTSAFCEDNWMRYLDHIMELPAGTKLLFEYGDPQIIKDNLGKKFMLSGLYPINLIKTGTKQQCVDKVKELLDIMLPGGGYEFRLDKLPISLKDINIENYIAVIETIRDYAVYDNAGENFGTPLNSEGFKFDENIIKPLQSKHLFDWEKFKNDYPLTPDFAQNRFEASNIEFFKFYMGLLM
ncbi:MAG: hypothetical protein ACOWWH_10805 [Eubacteriaceae bacterium]